MPYKDKQKQQEAQHQSYERTKALVAQRSKEASRSLFIDVVLMKEGAPCLDCNKFYPFYVMQYDHVRGVKMAGINEMVKGKRKGRTKVMEEIAKCDLVCANCHATRTYLRTQIMRS